MIDIVPTILEATGIPAPAMVNGIAQKPIEGVSMAYTWDKANANAPSTRTTQYFEMFGNRAHLPRRLDRRDDAAGAAVADGHGQDARGGQRLQVGALQHHRGLLAGQRPRGAKMPDKLREMQELFLVEATKYNVFPLDNSVLGRVICAAAERDRRAHRLHLLG